MSCSSWGWLEWVKKWICPSSAVVIKALLSSRPCYIRGTGKSSCSIMVHNQQSYQGLLPHWQSQPPHKWRTPHRSGVSEDCCHTVPLGAIGISQEMSGYTIPEVLPLPVSVREVELLRTATKALSGRNRTKKIITDAWGRQMTLKSE